MRGMAVIFQLFVKYWAARAPKSAGNRLSKAGFNVGFCRIGVRGINNKTPMKMTSIVTREETATLSVVMIPSSAVPASVPAISLAL